MYRLMIVDDDEILRKGLVNNIDWLSDGIEVVGEARNGKEAIDLIEEVMPNIIMSDIQMPIMNGLDLAEYIDKFYPKIKVILLTAYEEFEYAKKALKYGVCEYVLKYENNENIMKAVRHGIQQYEQYLENEELINLNKDILISHFFRDISFSQIEKEIIRKRIQDLGLSIRGNNFSIAMIQLKKLDDYDEAKIFLKRKELFNTIEKMVKEELQEMGYEVYSFYDKEYLSLVLVRNKNIDEKEEAVLISSIDKLAEDLEKILDITLLIGLGKWYQGIENLYQSYLEAFKISNVEYDLYDKENRVMPKVISYTTEVIHKGTPIEMMEKICHYIKENYFDESLSLNNISKQVHLSSNYVSTLFKKYKGINISDFIIQIRIKKAEELLVSTEYKTYEIANKIGYTNSQYFSVLFKKLKGLSPTEYRQKYSENIEKHH